MTSANEPPPEEAEPPQKASLPLNFGKRLAHTDKIIRDRGFRTLKAWLKVQDGLERLDYMKLWKGLYFAMWMADKRPVQQDLAVNMALLINEIPLDKRVLWVETFWDTMRASWEKLDRHRVNKYMLFIRIVLAEVFKDLRETGWDVAKVSAIAQILMKHVPKRSNSVPSIGITLQVVSVFWDELTPQLVLSPRASVKAMMALLEPFIEVVECTFADQLIDKIHSLVLKRAPQEVLGQLTARLLEGAARTDIPKKCREVLYDTADELEKMQKTRPVDASPLLKEAVAAFSKKVKQGKTKTPSPSASLKTPPAAPEEAPKNTEGKKKVKKTQGGNNGGMSPLMLPKAAVPVEESAIKALKKSKVSVPGIVQKAAARITAPIEPSTAPARGIVKSKKRKVAFDMEATKVTEFSEKLPVTSKRKAEAKQIAPIGDRRTSLKKRKI